MGLRNDRKSRIMLNRPSVSEKKKKEEVLNGDDVEREREKWSRVMRWESGGRRVVAVIVEEEEEEEREEEVERRGKKVAVGYVGKVGKVGRYCAYRYGVCV